ncbi:MAG: hypothetical protein AAB225_16315 [Acidobacteriota bacterium]
MLYRNRKSRMISFRVSDQDYQALIDSCLANSARSVSEVARTAVHEFLLNGRDHSGGNVDLKLEHLSSRLSLLDRAVERLAQIVHTDQG